MHEIASKMNPPDPRTGLHPCIADQRSKNLGSDLHPLVRCLKSLIFFGHQNSPSKVSLPRNRLESNGYPVAYVAETTLLKEGLQLLQNTPVSVFVVPSYSRYNQEPRRPRLGV